MLCTPGFVWGQQGAALYKRRATGEGGTFWERNKNRVISEECKGEMAASYLCHHMDITHGIVMPQNRGVDIGGGVPETYRVSFLQVMNSVV